MDDTKMILARALFDVLDAIGAMTKTSEIYSIGISANEIDNVLEAREIVRKMFEQGLFSES